MDGTTRTVIRETCAVTDTEFMPRGRRTEPCRSQSVHNSDEASNDRGAKGHRKEEMQ